MKQHIEMGPKPEWLDAWEQELWGNDDEDDEDVEAVGLLPEYDEDGNFKPRGFLLRQNDDDS